MINTFLRLDFEMVFPDEEKRDILSYLKEVPSDILIKCIGFFTTKPTPNYDNFFSDPKISLDVINRVKRFCITNNIKSKPIVVSRRASLRFAEIVLSNRKELIEGNDDQTQNGELNVFKAILIINEELNSKQKFDKEGDPFDSLVDMSISFMFSSADFETVEDDNVEFGKLIYTTIFKFEMLVEFLKSNPDYEFLERDLYEYFTQKNIESVIKHMKYLFGKLFELKSKNAYSFSVDDEDSLRFINSLTSIEISEENDFVNLRNYPIYNIEGIKYSIVDFFFVIDKFHKSVKFILKESFNKQYGLPSNSRDFFNFFNTEFSERFLMKRILDQIFWQPYFIKKKEIENGKNEPDYYVRHNNVILLFENKDVLIAKEIKSSGDIEKIESALKIKFLETDGRPIGIGQLVTSILQIIGNCFPYDEYVNTKKSFKIYPILLVQDRIFETPGINYRMNQWYENMVKERLEENYNPNLIKPLTVINIDILIYWMPYLVEKDSNFKKIIDDHLKLMTTFKKPNHSDPEVAKQIALKRFSTQIFPISQRLNGYKFPVSLLIEKFDDIITD